MSAFRFVGHLFYWIKKQKIFPKKKRWERVNFDFRFGCNRDFHLLGEKVINAFDIYIFDSWPLFVSHLTFWLFFAYVIFKTWDGAWQWWMFEGFLLCRWLLEPRKASRLCKWVHTTQESASFSNAQCTFHSSTCPLLYNLNAQSSSYSPSAQGTHATRPRCLTSPMERLSACLVELSTGALSTISYTDIQGSWRNMVSVNLSIFYPPIDDGLNCRYRCNEGVPMSGSESLYCDGNSWNGSVR